jgi:hypothetical protein
MGCDPPGDRWEVGSEFDWQESLLGAPSRPGPPLPAEYALFSTGRAALLSLARVLGGDGPRRTLHLPSFFCMDVAAGLGSAFRLGWYRDLPTAPAPRLESLRPAPGDLVLAVNLFGLRDGAAWGEWLRHQDRIVLVEDHTHDPFSPWARRSTAHYAMASLRKTLPIPDGALVWSPRGLPLPAPGAAPPAGAHEKLAAMVLKRAYLRGANIPKQAYRALQVEGERALSRGTDSGASAFTGGALGGLDALDLRRRRGENAGLFLGLMTQGRRSSPEPLFTTWPEGGVPYNPVLLCRDEAQREGLRNYLISKKIFCPVHWIQPVAGAHSGDAEAIDLSRRVLTIPVDHRCSKEDVTHVYEMLSQFESS